MNHISLQNKTIQELLKEYKKKRKFIEFKEMNDSFHPLNEKNIAIIIPFQNKNDEYHKYLKIIKKLYKNTPFDIFIINQYDTEKYNRGYLFNIGYYLARKKNNYRYYIFQDIHFLPNEELLKKFYYHGDKIIHYTPTENTEFLGGIIGMTGEVFEKINGYPNKFDDEKFYNRIAINHLVVYRPSEHNYIQIKNPSPISEKKSNIKKYKSLLTDLIEYKYTGLKEEKKDIDFIIISKKIELEEGKEKIYLYNVKIPIEHTIIHEYRSFMKPLITWKEVKNNILDTFTEPRPFKGHKESSKFDSMIEDKINKYSDGYKKSDLEKTLKFIFDTYQSILYVRIRQNGIEFAFHIFNSENFTSEWHKYIRFPNHMNVHEFMKKKGNKIHKIVPPEKWTSHDCVVHFTDFFPYWNNYVKGIYEMLILMIQEYKNVPDCDLLINNKDFHYLHVNPERYAFTHVYPEDVKIPNPPSKYWFLCSQSSTINNLDIPIPTADELSELLKVNENENENKINFLKRENKLFFRGATTGCGLDEKTNPRLRLCMISEAINLTNKKGEHFFDIGLSRMISKIKVNDFQVGYLNEKKYKYLMKDFVNMSKQKNYRFLLDIEGNVSAYRLPILFSYGSVVVHAESDYYMWFELLLKNGKDYILLKKEVFMKEGDSIEESAHKVKDFFSKIQNENKEMEKIAENGFTFYKDNLGINSILEYCFSLCYQINKKTS